MKEFLTQERMKKWEHEKVVHLFIFLFDPLTQKCYVCPPLGCVVHGECPAEWIIVPNPSGTLQILQTTLQKKSEIKQWVHEMYKLYLLPDTRSTLTLFSETPDFAVSVFACQFAKPERPTRSDISQHGLVLSGKHKMHLKRFEFWCCKAWLKWL